MLMITPTTDNPPATMVISIGSDGGFSGAGTGGTARGMIWGGGAAAAAGAGRTSAVWSATVAGALAPGFAVDMGSGQRVAAAGAIMFASLAEEGWLPSVTAIP